MNAKVKWLREQFSKLDIQGMIVSNPVNIKYLTNLDAEGILLLTYKENYFLTDGRYIELANNTLTIEDEVMVTDISTLVREDYQNFFMFCENVGFEEYHLTYAQYTDFKIKYKVISLIETEKVIEEQRIIKDREEIENIQKACQITDNCFTHLLKFIKKGMTEKQIALEIVRYVKQNGAEDISFEPIVATGENSSMPHAVPTDRKVQSGDVILIDMGCIVNGYCSDMTRTIFMDNIPEKVKQAYDIVLSNQESALKSIKDGENMKSVCKMIENSFDINGYSLIHSVGHGVGLDIHESPFLSTEKDVVLKENMVITCEPGIYIPGEFGVRIEDTVLVSKFGCIKLTNSGKNYTIIQ